MSETGVSIAIPNWNHELFLPRSIRSGLEAVHCLRESDISAEVLVIDDCSRDGSVSLLRQLEARYYDQGLRVLALQKNVGLADARNTAMQHAQHRYVTFMDADNELVGANLSIFYRAIRETKAAAVYGNLLQRGFGHRRATRVTSNESVRKMLFECNYIDAFSLVDRDQILDEGGYDSRYHSHHDYELWLHMICNGRKIVHVPAVFGYYYILPGSMIKESVGAKQDRDRLERVFDQIGSRKEVSLQTQWLRYHPDLGWL